MGWLVEQYGAIEAVNIVRAGSAPSSVSDRTPDFAGNSPLATSVTIGQRATASQTSDCRGTAYATSDCRGTASATSDCQATASETSDCRGTACATSDYRATPSADPATEHSSATRGAPSTANPASALSPSSSPPGAAATPTSDDRLGATLNRRLATWQARLPQTDPAADLAAGERAGARLVTPGAPEWPTQLSDLGHGVPLGLWLRGSADLRFSCLRSVAVVGARAATAYGVHVASDFAVELSDAGWTVVSGGAYGIDGAAHRGALIGGSPTIAVLANGVDVCYPTGHTQLFDAIREQGVLVSECPPATHPTRSRFLIRNRLIAALSRGTVVIEAAVRSGALNTAGHAVTLQRPLAAVPGSITSEVSAGCHRLIREGRAVCVTSHEQVVELVGELGTDLATEARGPVLPRDDLSETTRRVLDAVPTRGGAGTASIAVSAGVDLSTALSSLGSLAAAGFVERCTKGWRVRRRS
ncbi:DNA-processing protein DprA [Nonomuraea sp. NPDC050663]|uniref:DNA-processing protein DprA n=1 Tax=Nonomuraea sp. NPDC050663 TaxID=3364370 RepID=UPI00379DE341